MVELRGTTLLRKYIDLLLSVIIQQDDTSLRVAL